MAILRRSASILSVVAVLALWIHGCGPAQQPPKTPDLGGETPPVQDPCDVANEIELLLSDLVPTAAIGYGSISPFLYEIAADGAIQIAPNAVERDKEAAQKVRKLLESLNGNGAAQELFRGNIKRSQQSCGDCPRGVAYELREARREVDAKKAGLETVVYSLGGAPNDAEKSAFLQLMKYVDPPCPPLVQARFEGNQLLISRPGCPAKDCHKLSDDGHLGNACCTRNVPSGTWQLDESDPTHPRHCCISN
jgi:hypothetical protein